MEKIVIINNLISLVNLTSEEVLALVRELIAAYKLELKDCFRQFEEGASEKHVSLSRLDLFDENLSEEADGEEKGVGNSENGKVIVFDDNEDSEQSVAAEGATAETDTAAEPVKSKRGRPKRVKPEETTAKTAAATEPVKSKRGRPKKVKPEGVTAETAAAAEPVKSKRGRPKKVKPEEADKTAPVEADTENEAWAEAAKAEADSLFVQEKVKKVSVRDKNIGSFTRLSDCPGLAAQSMGAEQPFDYVYKWQGLNVLSRYVLSGMMPLGIYVPYKSVMFGKYHGFVLSLYEEKIITNAMEALAEAERSFEPIDGEIWSIMNSLQWGVVKNNQDNLSRMFRKVGGDGVRGPYKTVSPHSKAICGVGGFRYTVDI